jgi:osmotically-inducible protein OsmY
MESCKSSPARRALLIGAFALSGATLLQGCVPAMFVGVGAGALMATDRRTSGTYVEDESIEWKASNLVRQHFGSINHVNVTSYNRNVLITGEVQDEHTSAEIQRLVGTVSNVRGVANELVIAPPSSFQSRSNDAGITTIIKAKFVNNKVFVPSHVKVVTEAGSVFMLGLVTQAEAEHAEEIARTSSGVKKVVRVFEYIGEDDPRANIRRNEDAPPSSPPEAP